MKKMLLLTVVLLFVSLADAQCWRCRKTQNGSICTTTTVGICICTSDCSDHTPCTPEGCTGLTEQRKKTIRADIQTHKSIITVFMAERCVSGPVGKFYIAEAIRQGKAIRVVVPPSNMNDAERERWNKQMESKQDLWRLQDELTEATSTVE
jgi:hypothetical protein